MEWPDVCVRDLKMSYFAGYLWSENIPFIMKGCTV